MMEILSYGSFFLVTALSYAIICLGLNVQWGQTGLFNVGVAGFVGVGAYASAVLTTPASAALLGGFGWPIWAGWIGAALAGALISVAVGALTIRMRADYLAITTFGVAVMLGLVFRNAESLTGGSFGLAFVPRAFGALQGRALAFNLANLGLVAGVVVATYLLLEHLHKSPWGRALRAVREDETAAESLGKSPFHLRLQAFALGGAIMALGGAVQGHFTGFVSPGTYVPMMTFQVWAMLIVGGSGNNRGAVLGAVLVWAIWAASAAAIAAVFPPAQQARAASLQIVAIGVALCLILLARPQGIMPERHPQHRDRKERP